ncbi:hypothetical protein KAJ38_00940 [Candidatus Pacearchaeota archaeon]|nr:hypothetical protein [Candidatus Pacearchaeota archaeon]
MKDNPKLILGIGDHNNIGRIKNYIKGVDEDRIVFSERAGAIIDVTEAMKEINSGNYWGVLMSSLVLSLGSEHKKYSITTKKFEKFDHPPYIWRSGGLYVVEQACKNGLVTVVNAIAEGPEDLTEARRLGAKCFEDFSGTNAARTLRYFKSQL